MKTSLQRTLVIAAILCLGGCETLGYYTQAASGQLRILAARESIDELIEANPGDEKLVRQLRLVQSIRAYAGTELQLPVGEAYGAFVQLPDEYPLWNVVAAPEFSLTPKRWCYPIAGCASYRGYFQKSAARAKAGELRAEGYDVYLGPVPAYSTLGWFDDPVLSSFVNWSPDRLATLLFHELAHRRVYISGDTRFNESFATAVAQIALPDWRRRHGFKEPEVGSLEQAKKINALMLGARRQLQAIYASDISDTQKRERKAATLRRLRHCYREASRDWPNGERYRNYIEQTNNATIALISEYQSLVPAFVQLYRESGSLPAFYTAVERLGELDKPARDERLKQLAAVAQDSSKNPPAPSIASESCMVGGL